MPLFFFLCVFITDSKVGLERLLEETMLVIGGQGLCELHLLLNSSWLKYSISFIMRDPTVPLVPISAGAYAAIFAASILAMALVLYIFWSVGLELAD